MKRRVSFVCRLFPMMALLDVIAAGPNLAEAPAGRSNP
jgi:hypothetical protein